MEKEITEEEFSKLISDQLKPGRGELLKISQKCLTILKRESAAFERPHQGSCGPWAPCDGSCEALAYIADDIFLLEQFISKFK